MYPSHRGVLGLLRKIFDHASRTLPHCFLTPNVFDVPPPLGTWTIVIIEAGNANEMLGFGVV